MDYLFSSDTVKFDARSEYKLKTYKYKGGDLSYFYKYVLRPIAVFMVKLTPKWVR